MVKNRTGLFKAAHLSSLGCQYFRIEKCFSFFPRFYFTFLFPAAFPPPGIIVVEKIQLFIQHFTSALIEKYECYRF